MEEAGLRPMEFTGSHRGFLPELHAYVKVVQEVPAKCHAILRGEDSVDPPCGQQHYVITL